MSTCVFVANVVTLSSCVCNGLIDLFIGFVHHVIDLPVCSVCVCVCMVISFFFFVFFLIFIFGSECAGVYYDYWRSVVLYVCRR